MVVSAPSKGSENQSVRTIHSALSRHWEFADEEREFIREFLVKVIKDGNQDIGVRLRAVRCCGYLDEIDRRRDKDDQNSQHSSRKESRLALEQLLSTPEGRELLSARTAAAFQLSSEKVTNPVEIERISDNPVNSTTPDASDLANPQIPTMPHPLPGRPLSL